MHKLSVFDPPMSCSSGGCGPDAADTLDQFEAALDWARDNGAEVERHNMGHEPEAFAANQVVRSLIETEGMTALPLVLFDGEVLSKGRYPAREDIVVKLDAGSRRSVA